MNDVVTKLSQATEPVQQIEHFECDGASLHLAASVRHKSTLPHASEKAIESFLHVFNLLVSLAVEDSGIAQTANSIIKSFVAGQRHKTSVPHIGHLLTMLLTPDVGLSAPSKSEASTQLTVVFVRELHKAIVT